MTAPPQPAAPAPRAEPTTGRHWDDYRLPCDALGVPALKCDKCSWPIIPADRTPAPLYWDGVGPLCRRCYDGLGDPPDAQDRETRIVEAIDAELGALSRHAGDVANSSEGGAAETEWANGVDYAIKAIRRALDLAVTL